jgi:6-phosphogluconolactonase
VLVAGCEPRHFAFHPTEKFAYLMTEAGCSIDAFRFDAAKGTLSPIGSIPSLPPDAGSTGNSGAGIHVSPSGKFLYASNRGHDSIAIASIAKDGTIAPLGHESTRGKTPRTFALDPTGTFLFAANQDSGTIAVFRIDESRGTLLHVDTTDVGASPYFVGAVDLSGV